MRDQKEWQQAYEPLPDKLHQTVCCTLNELEEKKAKKPSAKTVVLVMALVLAVCGTAVALIDSKTADIFGWFYGEETKEALLSGDMAVSGESYTLGDVVYTLDEAVYSEGTLYGTGTIAPKDGANVVLMAEDYSVNDPAGHMLHFGDEEIPADAKTYLQLAEETGASILQVRLIPNGIMVNGELTCTDSIGGEVIPQTDGTFRFTFEISNEEGSLERQDSYELNLYIRNAVMDANDTLSDREQWETTDWILTVVPQTEK